jgi:hypothetical protein
MKNILRINSEVIEKPIDAIVKDIEDVLKPFQHKLNLGIEKENNVAKAIRITVEIKL